MPANVFIATATALITASTDGLDKSHPEELNLMTRIGELEKSGWTLRGHIQMCSGSNSDGCPFVHYAATLVRENPES